MDGDAQVIIRKVKRNNELMLLYKQAIYDGGEDLETSVLFFVFACLSFLPFLFSFIYPNNIFNINKLFLLFASFLLSIVFFSLSLFTWPITNRTIQISTSDIKFTDERERYFRHYPLKSISFLEINHIDPRFWRVRIDIICYDDNEEHIITRGLPKKTIDDFLEKLKKNIKIKS